MAVDKLVDSTQLDSDLTSVANAIRTKGGTSASLAFPADFISAINAISGGGSTAESGSFIATTGDSLTIPVTALHTQIVIWHSTFDADSTYSDLGANTRSMLWANNGNGFILQSMVNGSANGYTNNLSPIGLWGNNASDTNQVEFTASAITFTKMRIAGANRSFKDGDTYYWEAF